VRGCPGKARERAPPTPSQPTLCGGRRPGAWSRGLIWATTFRCPSPPYFSFIVSPHEQHHTHTSSRSHFTIAQSSPTPSAAKRPKINPAMSFVVRPSQPCPLPDHTPHVFVPSVAPPLVPTPTLQRVGAVSVVLADTEPLLLLLSVALCRKWHPTATFRTRTCPMACSPRRPMYADDSAHTHARTPTHPPTIGLVCSLGAFWHCGSHRTLPTMIPAATGYDDLSPRTHARTHARTHHAHTHPPVL